MFASRQKLLALKMWQVLKIAPLDRKMRTSLMARQMPDTLEEL